MQIKRIAMAIAAVFVWTPSSVLGATTGETRGGDTASTTRLLEYPSLRASSLSWENEELVTQGEAFLTLRVSKESTPSRRPADVFGHDENVIVMRDDQAKTNSVIITTQGVTATVHPSEVSKTHEPTQSLTTKTGSTPPTSSAGSEYIKIGCGCSYTTGGFIECPSTGSDAPPGFCEFETVVQSGASTLEAPVSARGMGDAATATVFEFTTTVTENAAESPSGSTYSSPVIAVQSSIPAGGSICPDTLSGTYNLAITYIAAVSNSKFSEGNQYDSAAPLAQVSLKEGILRDSQGRIGCIVADDQFQFDPSPQAGTKYSSGWSACGTSGSLRLALNDNTTFWGCNSGRPDGTYFANIYDKPIDGSQCAPAELNLVEITSGNSKKAVTSPSNSTAVYRRAASGCATEQGARFTLKTKTSSSTDQPSVFTDAFWLVSPGILKAAAGSTADFNDQGQLQLGWHKPTSLSPEVQWSICGDGSVAFGGAKAFYRCGAHGYYTIYNQPVDSSCLEANLIWETVSDSVTTYLSSLSPIPEISPESPTVTSAPISTVYVDAKLQKRDDKTIFCKTNWKGLSVSCDNKWAYSVAFNDQVTTLWKPAKVLTVDGTVYSVATTIQHNALAANTRLARAVKRDGAPNVLQDAVVPIDCISTTSTATKPAATYMEQIVAKVLPAATLTITEQPEGQSSVLYRRDDASASPTVWFTTVITVPATTMVTLSSHSSEETMTQPASRYISTYQSIPWLTTVIRSGNPGDGTYNSTLTRYLPTTTTTSTAVPPRQERNIVTSTEYDTVWPGNPCQVTGGDICGPAYTTFIQTYEDVTYTMDGTVIVQPATTMTETWWSNRKREGPQTTNPVQVHAGNSTVSELRPTTVADVPDVAVATVADILTASVLSEGGSLVTAYPTSDSPYQNTSTTSTTTTLTTSVQTTVTVTPSSTPTNSPTSIFSFDPTTSSASSSILDPATSNATTTTLAAPSSGGRKAVDLGKHMIGDPMGSSIVAAAIAFFL
ncbi:Hypothetical predicted protein [Lecanosticta acicola]|uniref:Cell wall mannoprotein PIR1-like C-terminal domain-containing protein n=1 Tax=Lecanosticta acicola TaxID=111012 RepID=A0AAI9E7G6_9PEZI|nr:Hypothetical predicted protein [Lecanosticta acicola]